MFQNQSSDYINLEHEHLLTWNMFIKWLKSSEKCEHSTRFRKLRKISIFWDFSKNSLFKLNFKIEVLAKWTVADLGLFRTVLNQIMMSYLERLMSFIPVKKFNQSTGR